MITQKLLKDRMIYYPHLGIFTWKTHSKPYRVGMRAEKLYPNEVYRKIAISSDILPTHRAAWLYTHGTMPPKGTEIDHINRNQLDNRITNLRLTSRVENAHNSRLSKLNTSGYKGVCWYPKNKGYACRIRVNNKVIWLGCYSTPEEAFLVREAAVIDMFGPDYLT